MSFLKKLFGSGDNAPAPGKSIEHEGFTIRAAPFKNGAQYQTAGTIEKEVGGALKKHDFIRAESHASYDDAVEFTLMKGRQIVDQQGERIFG
jgi:hypothetical protein